VPSTPETISGRVTSVNPKGLKLDGGAEWINFSKFARSRVPPMHGQTVSITLDGQGSIRAVETASGPRALVRHPQGSATRQSRVQPS
jgi:hypothetical protein